MTVYSKWSIETTRVPVYRSYQPSLVLPSGEITDLDIIDDEIVASGTAQEILVVGTP